MARRSKHILGIEPKMYRHFAALTIALSGMIALFANGEAQEVLAQTRQEADLKRAEKLKLGPKKLIDKRSIDNKRSRPVHFHDGIDTPMDGGTGGGIVPAGMMAGPAPIMIEVDQAALARMTPAQRAAYLKMLEDERRRRMEQGPVMPTQAQINALAAQSAARSGSDSIN